MVDVKYTSFSISLVEGTRKNITLSGTTTGYGFFPARELKDVHVQIHTSDELGSWFIEEQLRQARERWNELNLGEFSWHQDHKPDSVLSVLENRLSLVAVMSLSYFSELHRQLDSYGRWVGEKKLTGSMSSYFYLSEGVHLHQTTEAHHRAFMDHDIPAFGIDLPSFFFTLGEVDNSCGG